MADVQTQLLTGDDLLEIVAQNPDKRYELIEGELIEMPPPGLEHAQVENQAAFLLTSHNKKVKLGRVLTGEAGFYTHGHDHQVRGVDVAFISYSRWPADQPNPGYGRFAPELVIEVVSPSDRADKIEEKVQEWLDFGVLLVWVIYPQTQRIHVFRHGQQPMIMRADEVVSGEDAFPGFSAFVHEFFED
jgi:Uma2 family endonuclease